MGSSDSRNDEKSPTRNPLRTGGSRRILVGSGVAAAALATVAFSLLLSAPQPRPIADLVVPAPDFVVHAPLLSEFCRSLDAEACTSAARSSHFTAALTEITGFSAATLDEIDRIRRRIIGQPAADQADDIPWEKMDGEWIVSGQWAVGPAPQPPQKLFGLPDQRSPFPYGRILVAFRPRAQRSLAAVSKILDPTIFERFVRERLDPALSPANYDGIIVCGHPSGAHGNQLAKFRDPPALALAIVDDCVVFGTVADVVAAKRGKATRDPAIADWLAQENGGIVKARVTSGVFDRVASGSRFFFGDAVAATAKHLLRGTDGATTISFFANDRPEFHIVAPIAPKSSWTTAPRSTGSSAAWASLAIGSPARDVISAAARSAIDREDDERTVDRGGSEKASAVAMPSDRDIESVVNAVTSGASDGVTIEWSTPATTDAAEESPLLDAHLSDIQFTFEVAPQTPWPPRLPENWSPIDASDGNSQALRFTPTGDASAAASTWGTIARRGDAIVVAPHGVASSPSRFDRPGDGSIARLSIDGAKFAAYVRATENLRRRDDVMLSAREAQDLRDAARRHLIETAKKSTPTREEIENLSALWTATMIAEEREPRADRRRKVLAFLADWAPNITADAAVDQGRMRITVRVSPK